MSMIKIKKHNSFLFANLTRSIQAKQVAMIFIIDIKHNIFMLVLLQIMKNI